MEWQDMGWSSKSLAVLVVAASFSLTRHHLQNSWIYASNSGPLGMLVAYMDVLSKPHFAKKFLYRIGLLMFMENVVIWIMHAKCLIECLREMFLVLIRLLVL
jgi:hypothetical protein